jgi:hypothetical protein
MFSRRICKQHCKGKVQDASKSMTGKAAIRFLDLWLTTVVTVILLF